MMGTDLRSMRRLKEYREGKKFRFVKPDFVFDKLFEEKIIYKQVGNKTIKDSMIAIKDIELFNLGYDLIEEDVRCGKLGKGLIDDYNFMSKYLSKRHNNQLDSLDLTEYFK